jgi:hypothetical protein
MIDPAAPDKVFIRSTREGQAPQPVALLARTGGLKTIRVREVATLKPKTFGVYPFDLVDGAGKRLDAAVFAALPWQGAGPDPLGKPEPVTARMPATAPPSAVRQ